MGGDVQKALLELAGVPVVLRSARALLETPGVDGLVVVTRPEERAAVARALDVLGGRVLAWVDGGAERVDSVRAGVDAVPASAEVVLVHDAARCLVRPKRIGEVLAAAERSGAAVLAVRVRDTIKHSADGAHVSETLERAALWAAQTPQAVRADLLREALSAAARDGVVPTDDVALVERLGRPVALVEGDDDNLKLTSPADIAIAEALLVRRDAASEERS
jgi:2-C-methyl-D-erythritol 4-phosphate cytidylyltransferase